MSGRPAYRSLTELLALDVSARARETVGRTSAHLVARAASFMLLADCQASFEIEGERPPRNRLKRWGRAVQQAGPKLLTLEEIVRIDDYRATLQAHSEPLMPFIEWRPTAERNVDALNQTADLYRYFDCTAEAEFLYACVRRTVEHDLPREIDYLRRHGDAMGRITERIEMPDRLAENLIMFIRQNKGSLPTKRSEGEFKKLQDDEVALIEGIVNDAFDGF